MEIVSVFKGVWINIYPFLGYAFVHLHVLTLAYMYYITRMNNEPMGCMVKMFGTQTNQWSNIILEWWDHTLNMCTKTRRNIPSICYIIHYSGWSKYIKTRFWLIYILPITSYIFVIPRRAILIVLIFMIEQSQNVTLVKVMQRLHQYKIGASIYNHKVASFINFCATFF